ncbi:hypothetical protein BGX34_003137 [Mortierella sp. NVP85]|nr:hypothetical protein BGX34_003137 [Mortierella sp. NVP85]
MAEKHLQGFRVVSAASSTPIGHSTIFIPSKPDTKTGERIVLWRDIQREIKNADRVRDGNTSVVFMTDDDFEELIPQRILYHPGVVLDVIVDGQKESASLYSETSRSSKASDCDNTQSMDRHGVDVSTAVKHISRVSIVAADAIDKSLVVQSAIMDKEEQRSLLRLGLPDRTPWETDIFIQNNQITPVGGYISEQLVRMETTGIQEGDLFQIRTLHLLQQMLDKQQQTLNRQVILENRMQALMTQNYELHEYPIPRLFIVLPKPKKRKDKITHPLAKRYRLYFLCECGEHTTRGGRGNLPNRIHLAKHKGYGLDQPNEFFKQYGSYVLAIMKFLKYGAVAAGAVVPPLTLLKVVDGLDAIQKNLMMTTYSIGSLMDETIRHIQELEGNNQDGRSTAMGPIRLEDVEALEGADLRQLQLYLNDKDKGRVLGNLFRVFTHDGHVKWNYRKADIQRFEEVVTANRGEFYQNDGSITIRLGSNTLATQFYEALVKARGVQSLDIILEWDVTLADLQKFASAVTMAHITRLRMNGRHFKGPILDMLNNDHRYDPILELMWNGRMKEMEIQDYCNFFQRINVKSMARTSRLRKLALPGYSRPCKSVLVELLKHLSYPVDLTLEVSSFDEAFEDITMELPNLPCLAELILTKSTSTDEVSIKVSQSEIQSTKVAIRGSLIVDVELLLRRGYLTELEVELTHVDRTMSKLTELVQCNPKLRNIELGCFLDRSSDIKEIITSARREILSMGGSCAVHRVKLHLYNTLRRRWFPNISTIALEFHEGLIEPITSSSITTSILSDGVSDRYGSSDPLRSAFQDYGSSLSTLITDKHFHDEFAETLDRVTKESGSKIVSLFLDTGSLTTVGLEHMDNVIDRSHDLRRLEITFRKLHDKSQQEKLEPLIRRYGRRLQGLSMKGDSGEVWIPKVMALCWTRLDLPRLESFRLVGRNKELLPFDCVQWIATMLSAPPPTPLRMGSISGNCAYGRNQLSAVKLSHIFLELKHWEIVFKAMDYSTLKELRLEGGKLSMDHVKLLVDCVLVNASPAAELHIWVWSRLIDEDSEEWTSQAARLRSKVPNVVVALEQH